MRRSQSLLGLVGLILVTFGGVAYVLTQDLSPYVLLHLGLGAVLLVAFLAASFRDLGTLVSSRSTRFGTNAVVYSVLFLALLTGLNWYGVRHNHRFDWSEGGVYSLSPQTKSVLDRLDKPLEIQAFLEGGHDPEVEALLDGYANASPQVKIQLIDPDKQPEMAEKFGIRTYKTLRLQYGDQFTTVAQTTEEALTNGLIKVTNQKKQTVYVLEGHGEGGLDDVQDPRGFGQLKEALGNENYEVKSLVLGQEGKVPDGADIVVLSGPRKPLLDQEVKALEAYLLQGGRAVFLLGPRTGTELKPLCEKFGAKLGDDVVVDQVVRLFQGPALGLEPIVSTYGAHPITKGFKERTVFNFARSVNPVEGKPGITATSIAKTSQSSWGETDLDLLLNQSQASLDATDTKGPISVAVAATSDLKEMGQAGGEARLVVIGSGDFGTNKYANAFFNRDFFLNTIGWLGSQEQLVSIRARSVRASRAQLTPDQATAIFYLSVLLLPEILLVIGLAVWWRRSGL